MPAPLDAVDRVCHRIVETMLMPDQLERVRHIQSLGPEARRRQVRPDLPTDFRMFRDRRRRLRYRDVA